MNTFPIMLGTLCVFALAYRYYSAFIAAKVLVLDDRRTTPAHTSMKMATTMCPRRSGCCSAITSPPSPAPDRWSDPPWPRSLASLRDSSGS